MNHYNLKRFLSLFLAMVMVFTMVPAPAYAQEDADPEEEVLIQKTEEPTEEASDPTEESSEAAEEPSEEEESPTEDEEEPTEESSEPSEEPSEPSGDASDPAEETEKETEPVKEDSSAPSEPEEEENLYIAGFQAEMDRILKEYLGSDDVEAEAVPDLAAQLSEEDLSNAAIEILILAEDMQFALDNGNITEVEAEELVKANPAALAFSDYAMDYLPDISEYASSGTWTPVEGITVGVSGATNNSMSSGAVTVTAQGSGGFLGIGASTKTATITIYNESGSTATLSFDWTATSVNQLVIDGTTYTGSSGSFSKVMDAGASITATITTAKNGTTNKLVMSNFAIVEAKTSSNVTFQYDSTLGSVTVAGAAVANDDTVEVPLSGAQLVATPVSGAKFVGWVDSEKHTRLSTDTTYALTPADDMTVVAAFANSSAPAWFLVNGAKLYNNLNDAANAAGSGGVVVLAYDGTLPAGNYTIPSDVTLLIPFDDANTCYTTSPGYVESWSKPGFYRTLTMAEGAHITVNGAISLSAKHSASFGYNGMPTGNVSRIIMSSDSSITLNDGAKLYTWGYITGSGTVTAKSGSVVYEDFQLKDWRGGSQTTGMKNGVFPMSQYYIQNIEVPLTIESGAREYGVTCATLTLGTYTVPIDLFAPSGALFNITSGSLTKDYLEGSDQLSIEVNGDLTVSEYVLKISIYQIKTADFVFPIPNNFKIHIKNGNVTFKQKVSFYPGCEFEIDSGATVAVNSRYALYIYDNDQWGTYCYYNSGNVKMVALDYAPGRTCAIRTVDGLTDAKFCVNGTLSGSVYTSSSGAKVYSTGAGSISQSASDNTSINQIIQNINGDTDQYDPITFVPAILKNEDGSDPVSIQSGTNTYTYNGSKWVCKNHTPEDANGTVTKDPTCEEKGTRQLTCTVCKETYTQDIDAKGHDMKETTAAVAPTCDAVGFTAVMTCANGCGKTEGGTEVTALGHAFNSKASGTQATAANCTDPATNYVQCDRCNKITTEKTVTVGNALGHDESGAWLINGDNTKHYKICQRTDCDLPIAEDDHSGGTATCVNKAVCSFCKAAYGEADAVNGHDMQLTSDKIDPKCEIPGKEAVYTCANGCGKTEGGAVIPATGHDMQQTSAKVDATCEKDGKEAVLTCANNCGKTEGGTVIPATGHKDADTDHTCDYGCSESIGTCEDADKDHDCDYGCDKVHGEHVDADKNHTCDYGCSESIGTCEDTDKDHDCDYGCDKVHGEHKDSPADKDHVCDYCNSDEILESCSDAAGDKDHSCDVCGKAEITQHEWVDATCNTLKTCSECSKTEGELLPAEAEIDGYRYATLEEAVAAAQEGNTILLLMNTSVSDSLVIEKNITLDLNEKRLSADQTLSSNPVIRILAEVTVKNGTVDGTTGVNSYAFIVGNNTTAGELTIESGTYQGVTSVISITNGVTNISGGRFETGHDKEGTDYGSKYLLNCMDAAYQSGAAKYVITGGQFVDFNPMNNAAEGEGTNFLDETRHAVADETGVYRIGLHTEAEPVTENKVNATCTAEGSYDNVVYCTVCNAELSRNTVTVEKIAHAYESVVTAPTCTSGGYTTHTCSACGDTYTDSQIEATAHNYSSEVTKEASCKEEGVRTYTCTVCGSSYTEVIPQLTTHTPAEAVKENEVESTCTVPGSYDSVVKCSVCTAELSRETKALELAAHTEGAVVVENEVGATCTKEGSYDNVVYCTECNAELSRNTITVEKIDHTPAEAVKENEVESTCTVAGSYDEVVYCSVCGAEISRETKALELAAHTEGEVVVENEVGATCTTEGSYDNVVYCTVCEAELSRETVSVPAVAHNPGAAADCTTAQTCTVCSTELNPKLGHAFNSKASGTQANAATCTTAATYYVQCDRCDEITRDKTVAVGNAKGHDWDNDCDTTCNNGCGETREITHSAGEAVVENRTESTCTVAGSYDEVVYCSVCNTEISRETKALELAAHTEGETKVENNVDPTCTAEGSYDNVVYCTVCKAELSRNTVTVGKIAHTPAEAVKENEEESTCTVAGSYDEVVYCSVCGAEISRETKALELAAHTEGEVEVENEVAATCTKEGSYDNVVYCSVCNAELSRETKSIEKLPHTEATREEDRKEATCGEAGSYNLVTYCSVCQQVLDTESKIIPATGKHDWKDATYTAPKTCSTCGATEGDKLVLPPVQIIEPEDVTTDTPEGSDINDEAVQNVVESVVSSANAVEQPETGIEAEGNKEALEKVQEQIKDESGNQIKADRYETSLVITLSAVEVDKDNDTVVAKKVTFDVSPMLYALDESGIKVGEKKVEVFDEPITFHLPVDKNSSATKARVWHEDEDLGLHNIDTDKDGNKYVKVTSDKFSEFSMLLVVECENHSYENGVCTVCGGVCGHSWNDGEVSKPATCTEVGEMLYTCTVCSGTKTEEIAVNADAHNWDDGNITTDATCIAEGVKTFTCEYNDEHTKKESVEIDKDNHVKIVEVEAKAATCTEPGWDAYAYCSNCDYTTKGADIPATGEHTYVDGVCKDCGEMEPIAEPIELSAIEAALDAEIQLWLKVFLPDAFINDGDAYVVITKHGRWGPVATKVTTKEMKEAGTDARGRYKLIQGIASGEMTCGVDFEFYNGKNELQRIVTTSGKELGTKATYSILDYVKIIMNGNDAEQKQMMVALLTYGGYAQAAFDVDEENPAYNLLKNYGYSALSLDGVSADTITQRTIIEGSDIGIKATSMQPFLDSAIYLRLYLKLNESESINNYTFELTYATVKGTEETMMISAVPENDRYYVDIPEIPAAYLDYMYKVKVTNTQTGETYSVSTSVLVYLRNQMNSISDVSKLNLFKAMYLYNQAANKFFPNAVQ